MSGLCEYLSDDCYRKNMNVEISANQEIISIMFLKVKAGRLLVLFMICFMVRMLQYLY